MRLGCGYPMGPLALLDLIGLDTAYEILDTMYRQGRNRLHAPAPILKQMVTAGLLGRKTGRGFYTYEAADSPVVVDDARDAGRRRGSRSSGARSPGRRRRLGHDGDRHRRGLRQGRLSTSPTSPAARRRSTSVREGVDPQPREGGPARQARARPTATRRSATSPARTDLDDLAQRRPRRRGDRRGPGRQEGAVREPRRDLPRRRDPRHHHVVAAGHRARLGDHAARAT